MYCRKCGTELHENQKVCIKCGEVTSAGFNFEYGDGTEKKFKMSDLQVKKLIYGGVGVVVMIILIIIINGLRVIPPDKICNEWFTCMYEQRTKAAEKLMTEELVSMKKEDTTMTIDAMDYHTMIVDEKCKFKISKPDIKDKTATFIIGIDRNGEKVVTLKKHGRKWLVCDVK